MSLVVEFGVLSCQMGSPNENYTESKTFLIVLIVVFVKPFLANCQMTIEPIIEKFSLWENWHFE